MHPLCKHSCSKRVHLRGHRTPESSKWEQKRENILRVEVHAVRLFSDPVHCRPDSWISPIPKPNGVPWTGMGTIAKYDKLHTCEIAI